MRINSFTVETNWIWFVFLFCSTGHGAGPLDAVSGVGRRQTAMGIHSVRPGRRRADMSRRDDSRGNGNLWADGQVRRTVAERRHDGGRARGSRLPGGCELIFYVPPNRHDREIIILGNHLITYDLPFRKLYCGNCWLGLKVKKCLLVGSRGF